MRKVRADYDPTVTYRCHNCKRLMHPWPLVRGAKCSSKGWVYCIGWPDDKDTPLTHAEAATAHAAAEAGARAAQGLDAPTAPPAPPDTPCATAPTLAADTASPAPAAPATGAVREG